MHMNTVGTQRRRFERPVGSEPPVKVLAEPLTQTGQLVNTPLRNFVKEGADARAL